MEKDDDCVISGISGRFPNANNTEEFWSFLADGETATSESWPQRWPIGLYSLPPRIGVVKNIDNFDDNFFDLKDEVAYLDPCCRINYEVIYEAIWDAGINADDLRQKKVSLIRGILAHDSIDEYANEADALRSKSIGRIASDFGFMGPSFDVDNACASTLSALNDAAVMMKKQMIESAVILGNAVNLNPLKSRLYKHLQMNSADGKNKCLDASADGYCRSEAIAALFVQRRKDAKRIYASILSIATNTDGFKEEGNSFPKCDTQVTVMREAIKQANVDPLDIEYFEAHITGTPAGDPVECRSILRAFREKSEKPLKLGCLKSNIGHTEVVAGLCAIVKVACIFQHGEIPANLNFDNVNPNIEGLISGQLQPVTKKCAFQGDLIAVNAFGFGGSNVNCILRANERRSNNDDRMIIDKYPRLINICGRTEQQVIHTINWIKNNRHKVTNDFLGLLNDVSKISFESKMNYRGYMIIDENNNMTTNCSSLKTEKQKLWYVFSGFGDNWLSVASGLMRFEPFAVSFYKTAEKVGQFGVNLIDIVINNDLRTAYKFSENMVGVIATQLALFDTLSLFGLSADKIIGVSIGEIVCQVVNGSITREEMFASLVSALRIIEKQDALENGSVISVAGEYDEIIKICPPGVHPLTNFTTGNLHLFVGNTKQIRKFSKQLKQRDSSCKIETLFNHMLHCSEILTNINFNDCEKCANFTEGTQAIDAHGVRKSGPFFGVPFILRSLHSTVNLKQLMDQIPENASLIEISCNPVVTRIQNNNVSAMFDAVSLIGHNSTNYALHLITAIGEIYIRGHNPEIEKLYPKVEYPVSRETASLSPLLKWDHSRNHFVAKHPACFKASDYSEEEIDLKSEEFNFISDHVIDGRIFFPATAFLWVAWKHFSLKHGLYKKLWPNIHFQDVQITHPIICEREDVIELKIRLNQLTGDIVIANRGNVCFTANLTKLDEKLHFDIKADTRLTASLIKLDKNSVYKELRVRGYDYGRNFQGIIELDTNGSHCKVKNSSHIISLVDTMFQLTIFSEKTRDLYVLTKFGEISLNLESILNALERNEIMNIFYDKETETLFTDGLRAWNLRSRRLPRNQDANCRLYTYNFTPFDQHYCIPVDTLATVNEHNKCCVSLINSIKESNFNGLASFHACLAKFCEDTEQFSFLNSLKKAITEQKSTTDFIESLNVNEMNSFPISLKRNDLIEDQIQICLQNEYSKKLCIIEINDKSDSCKSIVENCCQLFDFSCDYNVLRANDLQKFASKYGEKVDLVILIDQSWRMVVDKNQIRSNESTLHLVENAHQILINGGFLLFCCRTMINEFELEILNSSTIDEEQFSKTLQEVSHHPLFKRIATKCDDLHFSTVLLRKVKRVEHIVTLNTDQELKWITSLQEELKENTSKQIWLKCRSDEISGIAGFMKCLLQEYGARRICVVVQDDHHTSDDILEKQLTLNIQRGNTFGTLSCRSFTEDTVSSKHAFFDTAVRGDSSSFRWFESPHKLWDKFGDSGRKDDDMLINVYYAALNVRDDRNLNSSNSNVNAIMDVGIEFSGITEDGVRVFGICDHSEIATTIHVQKYDFFFEVPAQWSLKDAATVTVAYANAYYSLLMRAKLRINESVLIHAGNTGVGLAAIRLCLSMNCDVFTSFENEEKQRKLMELFPELKERNFVDSRSLSFEENILKETNGRGVDVVLNSLSEDKLRTSIDCIAQGGRFIQIGKYGIINDATIGILCPFVWKFLIIDLHKFDAECFTKNYSFEAVCLSHLLLDALHNKSKSAAKQITRLKALMNEGIERGCIQPLHSVTFEKEHIEDAFRFMASGKNSTKVIIKIRDETLSANELRVFAVRRTYFYPSKMYLIIGGLGGMGLQLAHWMSERGARKLVLTSRRGITDAYQKYMISLIEQHGTEVTVVENDFSDYSSVDGLLKEWSSMSPIGGIFNVALVLKDTEFEALTIEVFQEVCKPKIRTTEVVDNLSRSLCPLLDYFVCFSSVIASMGREGQSNYAFANSAMEMICERRRKCGLPALAIQWGIVGDVGNVMESVKDNSFTGLGMKPQRIFSCLKSLDTFLDSNCTVCISKVVVDVNSSVIDTKDIVDHIFHITGARRVDVDENTTIADLGVDSLMVVEIGQMLRKSFNISLNSQQIRALSLSDVQLYGTT